MYRPTVALIVLLAAALIAAVGCKPAPRPPAEEITVYTSVDQPVAEPILKEFEAKTGIKVRLVTDTEATKSAGLAARLLAERAAPRADVWWGNEVFHTINLAKQGALQAYDSPAAATIPATYKDANHLWAGTCLRARVIATGGKTPTADPPAWATRIESLLDPAVKGRVGIATPTAGTTGGHVSALYALWGRDKADGFFRGLRANDVRVLGGNSVVAQQVADGTLLVGLTDNDDVESAAKAGGSIAMRLPDQQDGGIGTLTIPCTVGLVAGTEKPEAAKKLIDYLLSDEVERKLIELKFGQYSVRAAGASAVKTMTVTYDQAAEKLPWAGARARALLEGREPAGEVSGERSVEYACLPRTPSA